MPLTDTQIRYFCSECNKQFKTEKWAGRHNAIKEEGYGRIEIWEFGTDENGKPKGREVR